MDGSGNCDIIDVECPDQHRYHADDVQGREGRVGAEVAGQVGEVGLWWKMGRRATHPERERMRWASVIGLGNAGLYSMSKRRI